jgi:putative glutamine amidotransferase
MAQRAGEDMSAAGVRAETAGRRGNGRPVIGISSGRGGMPVTEGTLAAHYVGRGYVRAVAEAGGIPLVLPPVEGREQDLARASLELIDGLVLSGGDDIDPARYGGRREEAVKPDSVRDEFELALLEGATDRGIPVLGICRGMELINIAYGGSLRTGVSHVVGENIDLPELGVGRCHPVSLARGSRAASLFEAETVEAVCVHHQAPDRIGQRLVASGVSADGLVEVLEDADRWVLGVIWHPEQALGRAPSHRRVYEALVEEAKRDR